METDVENCLQLQLSELEMLQSMFPNPSELVVDGEDTVPAVQRLLDGEVNYEYLTERVGFVLKIEAEKSLVEFVCHLPHRYPTVPPEVFIRCSSLSRHQDRQLQEDLDKIIKSQETGDICLGTLIQWVQDNISTYVADSENEQKHEACDKKHKDKNDDFLTFSRLWIYSHHIYSKIKRKDILDYSSELSLTGFCMPGKPGIICVEGYKPYAEDFWQRIRRMTWKKITLSHEEHVNIGSGNVDDFRKFGKFEEKHFEPRQGKGRGAHCDRGLLYQFLEEKGCGYVFQIYFGIEGRNVVDDDSD